MLPEVARAGQADVYAMFRTRAREQEGALALEDGEARHSYGILLDRVDRLAAVLLARGVKTGDRVVILSHNRAEYLELQLAAAGIGAIVACLNWRLAAPELKHCIASEDFPRSTSGKIQRHVLETWIEREAN